MSAARRAALSSLLAVEKSGRYAHLELASYLDNDSLSPEDKRFYTALFYGVLERTLTLDFYIARYCKRKPSGLSPYLKNVLRLGFYQLLYMNSVPERAVLFESAQLAKAREGQSAAGLTTAVLRAYLRDHAAGVDLFSGLGESARRSLKYSLPEWMLSLWDDAYGKEQSTKIAAALAEGAPQTLRVNTLKTTPAQLQSALTAQDVACEIEGDALRLLSPVGDVRKLCGFQDGLFYVQDAACIEAVAALHPQPGDTVIDTCAAPGGKSFAAAIAMQNRGEILAFDLHPKKLGLIESGAARLGITIIKTGVRDASGNANTLYEYADKVICDVPCSGLGVLAKKPDIRRKAPEDIAALNPLQASILDASAALVRPGGKLLYATCTLNPAENECITDAFLKNHADFLRADKAGPHTIFPVARRCDGFFYDVLTKVER